MTYEGKACSQAGVRPHKHGIIYDERKTPKSLSGEPPLGYQPVRATMYKGAETLARESRVNYASISAIEHNMPVWFIGEVHVDDFRIVKKAYDRCWMKQNHGGHHCRRDNLEPNVTLNDYVKIYPLDDEEERSELAVKMTTHRAFPEEVDLLEELGQHQVCSTSPVADESLRHGMESQEQEESTEQGQTPRQPSDTHGEDETLQRTIPLAPTDSGYGSASAMDSERSKSGDQVASQSEQELADQDTGDTASEYSNTSSTSFSRQRSYISELANYLASEAMMLHVEKETQNRVSAILPDILKAFALRLGHHAPTQMHRDVMAFVHRYRR